MLRISIQDAQKLSKGQLKSYAYNAVDCIATYDVFEALEPRLNDAQRRMYKFNMAAQMPAFSMTRRGTKVDVFKRDETVLELKKDLKKSERALNKDELVLKHWDGLEKVTGKCPSSTRKDGKHSWERGVEDTPERTCTACGTSRFKRSALNPRSPDQVKHLLYDLLKAKPQRNKTGEVSTDKDALLRVKGERKDLIPLVDQLLHLKDISKQIGTLESKLSHDNRWHSSFNVSAAWTQRWSSNSDMFGHGGNAQNITERHRSMFIADEGMLLCYMDLKQAESKTVAYLAGDDKYIEAHDGDTHTYATRMIWPEHPWTWDIKKDKALAQSILPEWDPVPGHDIRFQSKKFQHGSNYGLTPFGIAMINKVPLAVARSAQRNYFKGFPGIPKWHGKMRKIVEEQLPVETPLGLQTHLFGRPWDDHTFRQALSLIPQSVIAHIIAIAAWRIERELGPEGVQLLKQVHDALFFQFPEDRPDLVNRAAELMRIPVPVLGLDGKWRRMVIDVEAAVGKNWGHESPDNPEGIKEVHV